MTPDKSDDQSVKSLRRAAAVLPEAYKAGLDRVPLEAESHVIIPLPPGAVPTKVSVLFLTKSFEIPSRQSVL